MAGLRKVGGEILVNTTTAGEQLAPEVVRLSSGEAAIAWTSGNTLFGRIYSQAGVATTPEFEIESYGSAQPLEPGLAPTADGGFLAAVYRLDATGNVVDGFEVDDQGAFVQAIVGPTDGGNPLVLPMDPELTRLSSGDFVLTYAAEGADGSDIFAWLFDKDDPTNPLVIPVNALTAATQADADVAALASGGFVVTWEDNSTLGGDPSGFGVRGQVFDAAGAKVGSEFRVNTATGNNQLDASVIALGTGFVIAWTDLSGVVDDTNGSAVRAQRFDASGSKVGGEFLVNTTTQGNQSAPVLAALPGGGFVAAWQDSSVSNGDMSGLAIRAQRFTNAGAKDGGELLVNTTTAGNQSAPSIAILGTTDILVSWVDGSAGNSDIRAQRLDLNVADNLIGTTGPDVFVIDDPNDEITDTTPGDGDRAIFSISYALDPQDLVETLETSDPSLTTPINLTGGNGSNSITGNAGNNRLDGGGGADTLTGLGGDDTYVVDQTENVTTASAGDRIIEAVGGGNDTVIALVSYALNAGAEVENMTGNVNLLGNEFSQTLTGGAAAQILDGNGGGDVMIGKGGDDSYRVQNAADVVVEVSGEGNDIVRTAVSFTLLAGNSVETLQAFATADPIDLTGNELSQILDGNNGNNRLDGGAGVDQLIGRLGDDTYVVDNVGDTVKEVTSGGIDTVLARTSWAIGPAEAVEQISTFDQAGTETINLFGNQFAQAIYGNAGNNYLDGGAGADLLTGFAGNDQFGVDNLGDVIVEGVGGGNDVAWATATYVLGAGVEVETLSTKVNGGTETINLYGNEFANSMYGNAGNNVLDGRGGADVMRGLGGNDAYYVDDAGDTIVEAVGGGTDVVWVRASYALNAGAQVETLSTAVHGATDAFNLTGNEFANAVYGNAGANIVDGGRGADTLYGLGGNDTFAFTAALGGGNVDFISDFAPGADRIALENAVFTALAPGALAAGAFFTGAAAHDADDRIIYNNVTGALLYDADGIGGVAAVQFATLSAGPAFGAGDFLVI